ncbi:unnamed protein product [Rotaria sordida]|uniref:EF-hand domain-containing protein n=1 Tax=Rotaria sordida TaxID=392033 RepID=A0A819Y0Q8_9BILA|nr:unnamed protein product [Rotaria sordida]CAF1422149.1 unnamed protein product [Rotaria sordida]CAF4116586.1 unnamed protein product [Rotaria sordida]CAF4150466.1 unnamed protein product [Rotaria sordida]
MKGSQATQNEIVRAFHALDTNRSGSINIDELAAFMPVIVPNGTSQMLLNHITKVDKDNNYSLDFSEFTNFIKKGIGRQLSLGRS